MIDKELHKNTQYRIPQLRQQFNKIEKNIGSYILLENNWDGYESKSITLKRIKLAVKVLWTIYDWFEKNIGFLNNRSFKIYSAPLSDGNIHIDIEYGNCYIFDVIIGIFI